MTNTLWNVEWYANGELNAWGKLTDEQIKTVTSLVMALSNANELLESEE